MVVPKSIKRNQLNEPTLLRAGASPDARNLALLIGQGRTTLLIVFDISPEGKVGDKERTTVAPPGTYTFMWISHDKLMAVDRKDSVTRLYTYNLRADGLHRDLEASVGIPAIITAANAQSGTLEVLLAISTPQGLRFGLFLPEADRYRLLTSYLPEARFGFWDAPAGVLGINIPNATPTAGSHGIVYEYSESTPKITNIMLLTGSGGSVRAISEEGKIAVTSIDDNGRPLPGIVSLKSGQSEWMPEVAGMRASCFSTDGQSLLCGGPFGADWRHAVVDLYGAVKGRVETQDGIVLDPVFCQNSRYVLARYEAPDVEPGICCYDLQTNHCSMQLRLSDPSRRRVNTYQWWTTGKDRIAVPVLTFESDEGADLALIYLHGGPHVHVSKSYSPLIRSLVDLGFSVVAPNFPGSTGYGVSYEDANRGDWGGIDLQSIITIAEDIVRRPSRNGVRPALYGVSYGGYLALLAAGLRPDLWSCVIACAPVTDLQDLYSRANERTKRYLQRELGPLLDKPSELMIRSPLHWVESIAHLPVLIVHGANDGVCPVQQSRLFAHKVSQMSTSDASFEYVEIPDLGHERNSERLWKEPAVHFIKQYGLGPYTPRDVFASEKWGLPQF